MKIFVDENIPLMTIRALKEKGHEITDIRKTKLQGMPDPPLWDMCQREKCILITTDKGFTQYRNQSHNGILIVRLRQPNRLKIHERVIKAFSQFRENEWKNRLVIMRDAFQSTYIFPE